MKIKVLFFSILFACLIFLLSVHYQTRKIKIECPQEVRASTFVQLPFDKIPSLRATLELIGSAPVDSREIGVELVPKQENRVNSPLLIRLSQIQLNDVQAGNYNLKVTLRRADDNLVLATLDLNSNIQPGVTVDFSEGKWDYACSQCDADHDHYNNLTEIMNGKFEAVTSGTVPSIWVPDPTDANLSGGNSFPEKPRLLRPAGISAMSPGPGGRLKIVGDPFSVQSAVYVTADLLNSNGVRKGRGEAYSRIDGSFDLNFENGAVVGDRVLIYTITQKGLGDAQFDSSRADVGPNSKVELTVKDLQGCQ